MGDKKCIQVGKIRGFLLRESIEWPLLVIYGHCDKKSVHRSESLPSNNFPSLRKTWKKHI